MYEDYFGLKQKPFDLVPNPQFLFLSKSHQKAISYLEYGLQEKAGFILLSGEIGSGKTTTIREIISRMDSKTALALVFNTRVTSEQLIAMINEEFGLHVEGKGKVALLRDLNDYLIEQYSKSVQPIIIIDEAQNLSMENLEEIRLLSNLETGTSKLVQIVLVGQPELKKMISFPELEQLRQRINIACHITPLNKTEMEEYIFHRLEIAGNRNAVTFLPGTFDVIYQYSQGIPRLVNIFCDFLLLSAFAEKTKEMSVELVQEVVGDVALRTEPVDPDLLAANNPGFWRGKEGAPQIFEQQLECLRKIQKSLEILLVKQDHFLNQVPSIQEKLTEMEEKNRAGFLLLRKGFSQLEQNVEPLELKDPLPNQPTKKPESHEPEVKQKRKGLRWLFGGG